jgi:hypothetical protein
MQVEQCARFAMSAVVGVVRCIFRHDEHREASFGKSAAGPPIALIQSNASRGDGQDDNRWWHTREHTRSEPPRFRAFGNMRKMPPVEMPRILPYEVLTHRSFCKYQLGTVIFV